VKTRREINVADDESSDVKCGGGEKVEDWDVDEAYGKIQKLIIKVALL